MEKNPFNPDQNYTKSPENLRGILPIEAHKEQMLEALRTSDSLVLVGETGSGKTTVTPRLLLERFPDEQIVVTSPRVLPAKKVSEYVAGQMGERVGDLIGVITRDERVAGDSTRCLFMTDGVLLNMLRRDPLLEEVDIVMVDEAHERGLNVDISLGLLKRAQKLREEKGMIPLKVIVASATIEEKKFTEYFEGSPLVKVPGRMYPVDVSYFPPNDRYEYDESTGEKKDFTHHAAQIVDTILSDPKKEGDILVFMPGEAEISKTIRIIKQTTPPDIEVLALFGSMNPQDQDAVFTQNGKRKVIISTNVAETSITIDTVKHVIDSGFAKEKVFHAGSGISSLDVVETSQANVKQRIGRAGRVSPGYAYLMFSEENYKKREAFSKPEILRSDLSSVILSMKTMGIDDIEDFEYLDKPSDVALSQSLKHLARLGALDQNGVITDLGREMAELPVEPGLARALIEAKHLGCLHVMIDVVAMLAPSQQLFFRPKEEDHERFEKERAQNSLRVNGSDYLTALNVWRKWVEDGYSHDFAVRHAVNIKALREAGKVRDLLLRQLSEKGYEDTPLEGVSERDAVTKCLIVSEPDNIFFEHPTREGMWTVWSACSQNAGDRVGVSVFPGSSAFKSPHLKGFMVARDVYNNANGKRFVRRCHPVTFQEIKESVPQLITTEEVSGFYGEPSTVTKINGVEIKREHKEGGGYSASSGFRTRATPYGYGLDTGVEKRVSFYDVMNLEINGVALRNHNHFIEERVREYASRNKNLRASFVDWQEKIERDIDLGLITSLQDAKSLIDVYTLRFEEYVTQEQVDETDEKSPKTMSISGVEVPIKYVRGSYEYSDASEVVARVCCNHDSVARIKQKGGVSTVDLPLVDRVEYEYRYEKSMFEDTVKYTDTKYFKTYAEMERFALTNQDEAKLREAIVVSSGGMTMAEIKAFYDGIPSDGIFTMSGKVETKEKKELLASRLILIRGVCGVVSEFLKSLPDTKPRNKLQDQITSVNKEIRRGLSDLDDYKRVVLEVAKMLDVIKHCENILSSHDMVSLLGVKDKRYLRALYGNVLKLEEAAKDGDVQIDDEIAQKIIKKALDSAQSSKPVLLSKEEADEEIINLL